MGRVVTSKSKTTRGALKIGLGVGAGVYLGGVALPGLLDIFLGRGSGQTSEQNTPEAPGQSVEEWEAAVAASARSAYQEGLFRGAKQAGIAAGAGAATGGGACAAPLIVETVCKLCGG